jgi:hypothetical protein
MAVGNKIRGILMQAYYGGVKIAAGSKYEITIKMDTTDTTDHDAQGWGSEMTTLAQWTASISGFYLDLDTNQRALDAAMEAGTLVTFIFYPSGVIAAGSGASSYVGQGYFSDVKMSFDTKTAASHDISIVGQGPLTYTPQ